MESKEIVKHLKALVHLDIDAYHAYHQAIEKIDLKTVKDQLTQFQQDHKNHVEVLSEQIKKLGDEPPNFSLDFKGFLIQEFTALEGVFGTEGALHAMKSNEELTNKTYKQALCLDLPPELQDIIQHNQEDEARHLHYIEQAIENRVWKKGERAA